MIRRLLVLAALPALFACNIIPKTPDLDFKAPKFDGGIPNPQQQGPGTQPPQNQQPINGGPNNGAPNGGPSGPNPGNGGGAGSFMPGPGMGPGPGMAGGGNGMQRQPSAKVMFQMKGVQ